MRNGALNHVGVGHTAARRHTIWVGRSAVVFIRASPFAFAVVLVACLGVAKGLGVAHIVSARIGAFVGNVRHRQGCATRGHQEGYDDRVDNVESHVEDKW